MFIVALSTIAKTWEQPTCLSTDERIKKIYIHTHTHTHTHTHNGILPCNKRMKFCHWQQHGWI